MRTGSADFHQGSSKPNICLQLFCQLSLIGNKKVDAMRCPYKLFRFKDALRLQRALNFSQFDGYLKWFWLSDGKVAGQQKMAADHGP